VPSASSRGDISKEHAWESFGRSGASTTFQQSMLRQSHIYLHGGWESSLYLGGRVEGRLWCEVSSISHLEPNIGRTSLM
jgi:hypothetical protein